jgi:hypothetical protein
MDGNATPEDELCADRGNPIATENQTRYIRPMVDMTLFAALFLSLSGLLLARLSLRSKLTPLLRRAR